MENEKLMDIGNVYNEIKVIIEGARKKTYYSINFNMVEAYWNIGKNIIDEEFRGKSRAEYGKKLIEELSKRLTKDYGKGFDKRNLWYMKNFYNTFTNVNALRSELSWTHYRLLLKISKEDVRSFYMIEAINNKWSSRELDRQIDSLLYERIALSRDKEGVKELSLKGQVIQKPKDIVKSPYVLEFLDIQGNGKIMEKDLEKALIEKLKTFLLELGKGFSFIGSQKRLKIGDSFYYVDLVFYNYILKCFVLIDLKTGKLTPQDIGQMDFYMRYFSKEEKQESDNEPIGIILCSDKDETMVKYTLLEENKNIFASKYKLYLPTEEELRLELAKEKEMIEIEMKFEEEIE